MLGHDFIVLGDDAHRGGAGAGAGAGAEEKGFNHAVTSTLNTAVMS